MSKIVTVRLADEEYRRIVLGARNEHRPISNFIAALVLKELDEGAYVDAVEMAQIRSDKTLLEKLKAGHRDAKNRRGKLVG